MNRLIVAALSLLASAATSAQTPPPCELCATWNVSQAPFRLYGNAYYVGVHGLASVLITSDSGHILIDGDLPESAPKVAASIRALGFRIEDVKLILNSHVHYDHAGGIAELQRLSGAQVAASAPSAEVLKRGQSGPDDPQFGVLPPIAKISRVQVFKDGETLRVGPLEVSAPAYPHAMQDFEKSFATLASLPCDLLVSVHPEMSNLWGRLEKRERGDTGALIDPQACEKYVDNFRERLRKRVADETAH
jgi:metallo-beta-lactamase class B